MFKSWIDYNIELFLNRDIKETLEILLEIEALEKKLNVYYPDLTIYISENDQDIFTVETN